MLAEFPAPFTGRLGAFAGKAGTSIVLRRILSHGRTRATEEHGL